MPRSKTRKRNGQPVRYRGARYMRRPGEDKGAELPTVTQADMGKLIDGLEELVRLVPTAYNPTSMAEAVEHHHHATSVINYLREHDMLTVFAALAGGDMIVLPSGPEPADPDAPALCGCPSSAAEADEHYSGCLAKAEYVWAATARKGIDYHQISHPFDMTTCQRSMASSSSITLSRADAEARGLKPCPRCYPGQPFAPTGIETTGQNTVTTTMQALQEAARERDELYEDGHRCPVCRQVTTRYANGAYRRHGRRDAPCAGTGMTFERARGYAMASSAAAASGATREVLR